MIARLPLWSANAPTRSIAEDMDITVMDFVVVIVVDADNVFFISKLNGCYLVICLN